ncbi:Uncharacterized protein HZ326_8742 [Fusarium oxysporum f. sp. albedinis]|nr:Uncharacterized protein HZ326_8742 [Fusarium oxysporum f. sp. albedinis]
MEFGRAEKVCLSHSHFIVNTAHGVDTEPRRECPREVHSLARRDISSLFTRTPVTTEITIIEAGPSLSLGCAA